MSRTRAGCSRPKVVYSVALGDRLPELPPTLRTERTVWLSRTVKCRVHTLAGVPANRLTLLIQEGEMSIRRATWVVQVCLKEGRYDGSVRPEIIIRQMPKSQVRDWPVGQMICTHTADTTTVQIIPAEPGCEKFLAANSGWECTVERVKSQTDQHDPARCYMWHWSRYYRMIPRSDAEQLSIVFAASIDATSIDLNEMNRLASRDLYSQAKALGWRKLTVREQTKYGVSGQWHQLAELEKTIADRLGNPSGCGDYTLSSANPRR